MEKLGTSNRFGPDWSEVLAPTPANGSYDLDIPDAMRRHLPKWFYDIPWERSREQELPAQAIDTLRYMARVEGYVCGGYLPIVLSSPRIRAKTRYIDFVAGAWGPDENGHSVALYTFLDLYHGRTASTRASDLDTRRAGRSMGSRVAETLLKVASGVAPETFLAAYAVIGYRNEVMTQRGYASLRSRVNEAGEHPVLSPILHNIMAEESDHAKAYKELARAMLEGEPARQRTIRRFLGEWPGVVGEGFGGSDEADKALAYLFEDAGGRDMITQVDKLVGMLPGLEGVTPTKKRLEIALNNQKTPAPSP